MITDSRLGPTAQDYIHAFNQERLQVYPAVTAFEERMGYAVDRERLEAAARVLACPLKVHAPNWQHGRILYAAARRYIMDVGPTIIGTLMEPMTVLDIGTAKGFSALCLAWALSDAGVAGTVHTCDVIDPTARIRRNTIADLDGLKTLSDMLAPWPESEYIEAWQMPGVRWLENHPERIHIAFVDGKHSGSVVWQEGRLLADRQQAGDLAIFDDVDRPDIWDAVQRLSAYQVERLTILPHRAYAIGVRR